MSGARAVQTVAMTEAVAHGACALCTVLRHYQTQVIMVRGVPSTRHLCNQHAWLVARSAPAALAARIYAQVLETRRSEQGHKERVCDFCAELRREEAVRLGELVQQMKAPSFAGWMRRSGTLCLRHAEQLSQKVPGFQPIIDEILSRTIAELEEDLVKCVGHETNEAHNVGGGVLGRVAEFLVCQRGIPGGEKPC